MSTKPIDYDALAKQYGATTSQPASVDYDALAKQYGATSSTVYHGKVPQEQLNRIQSLNANPTKFEQERAPAVENSQTVRNPWSEVGNFLGNTATAAAGEAKNIVKSVPDMGKALMDPMGTALHQAADTAIQDQLRKNRGVGPIERKAAVAGSVIGLNVPAVEHASDIGNPGGVVGTLTADVGVPVVAGELIKGAAGAVKNGVRPPLQGVLADRMAEVPAGEQFTRQQVLDAARNKGVNLDLAQATDNSLANGVKKGNRYSLAAEGTYDANAKTNLQKLDEWANSEASKYAPEPASKEAAGTAIQSELERQRQAFARRQGVSLQRDADAQLSVYGGQSQPREVVGTQLQQALKNHLEARQTLANQMFSDVEKSAGTQKVDVTGNLADAAQEIIKQNKDYYSRNQSLLPNRAWGIVNDIANQKTATITDLQRLRSDLMNEYRSPDIAGSRAEGWLKQLAGAADDAMTQSGKGLTGENLQKWRAANSVWESIKNTYDNPQSPYYHAVRSGSGSQVFSSMSSLPPEYTRGLQGSIDPQTFNMFQRANLEKLMDPKGSGSVDFAGLEKRVADMGDAKLNAMFGDNAGAVKRFSQRATDIANAQPFGEASNPLNKAAQARNPLDVVPSLSGGGPELARQVQNTIGTLKGQFQRQFVENLLSDKNGNMELGRLQQKLKAIPQDHLEAMLGKDGAESLKMLASVSKKVLGDANPSGTAKTGIPRAEMAGLGGAVGTAMLGHPVGLVAAGGEMALQRTIGKAINSAKVIDYLTKRGTP